MFQCILARLVHCLHKAISLTGKEFINFQGVWDGFNCCFSKSGENELFLHFLPNSNYPLPNSQGWGTRGYWWKGGWDEKYSVSHTILAPWHQGTSNREKLGLVQKVLSRRIPFGFLQLSLLPNAYFPRSLQTLTHMFDFSLFSCSSPFS